jgi:hypothetical protein
MSVPIVFQINNKNIDELGCLLIEDGLPICIQVNIDIIALISKEDDESLINIIVETLLHERYHELFHNEVPDRCHHYMIEKLNWEYKIKSIQSYRPDWRERIEGRKKTISEDISVMYC